MIEIDQLIHLSAVEITVTHDLILASYPGLGGVKPGLSVDALVGRIAANLFYQYFESLHEVAALYAEVIARGHVFNDGNKRTAFVCMINFLEINGHELVKVDQDVLADQIVEIAERKLDYPQFAAWLKPKIKPL